VIAGVVLAAGLSRRMGRPKLLLFLEGRPVIRISVEGVVAAGLGPVVVVTGAEHREVAQALAGLPVLLVNNPAPEAGQAGSLRIGTCALPDEAEAALIALGDQPFVPRSVIPRLLGEFRATGQPIVAPRYRDGRGNPVLFARSIFSELLEVSGDQGARSVMARHPDRVLLVDFEFPMPQDVDTPEDYAKLQRPDHPV